MKNILYIALIFLSVSAWATQVTLKVLDQTGSEIALSTITVTGYGTFNTGASVDLPEGTYAGSIQPGMGSLAGDKYYLTRPVTFNVDALSILISFEWIASTFSIDLVDQNGITIPLSKYYPGGWAGNPSNLIEGGESVRLPITDESLYSSLTGVCKNGYPIMLIPGINDLLKGYPGHLWRSEKLEVTESRQDTTFEWITSSFTFDVVDQGNVTIPHSTVSLWGGNFTMNVGESVTFPITDTSIYKKMGGGMGRWIRFRCKSWI